MDFTGNTLKIVGSQFTPGNVGVQGADSNKLELVIDNYISQKLGLENTITRQPTSRGTPSNDSIYREPAEYTISGVLSSSTLSSSLDFNISSLLGSNNYLSTKADQVFKSALGQYIFSVYTGVNFFPSMGIRELNLERRKEAYNCLWIDLVMQEIIVATTSNLYNTKNNSDRPPASQGIKNG